MIPDCYNSADYDGLTEQELAEMRKDTERDRFKAGRLPIWTSKTKFGYTPIFIGKSGALYVGGVKLKGGTVCRKHVRNQRHQYTLRCV